MFIWNSLYVQMERVLRSCNNFIEKFPLQNPLGLFLGKIKKKWRKRGKNLIFLAETITHLPWRSCSTYAAEFSVAERVKIIVKGRTFYRSSTFAPNCDYHSTRWISWSLISFRDFMSTKIGLGTNWRSSTWLHRIFLRILASIWNLTP